MKLIFIFLISYSLIFCQDSTYWFDFKTLKKNIPNTPKVLDKIFEDSSDKELINSDALFDQELLVKINKINNEKKMFFKIFILKNTY